MAEYGIFTDEGCVDRGYLTLADAEQVAEATRMSEDDENVYAAELCPEHDEEPRDTCEECATDSASEEV